MSVIFTAPTGKVIAGHVLDVNRRAFDQALRFYDKQLYTKWNPKKMRGWGCWEIRRKPDTGTREYDFIHHILDCAYLNYDQLRKLKKMDTWEKGGSDQWLSSLETWEREALVKEKIRKQEAMAYAAKQYKTEIRAFKEMILSGVNPARIVDHWGDPSEMSAEI